MLGQSWCSVIPHCYIAQSFSIATVLSHFALLQCSTIPRAKGAQSFIIATVLSHFPLKNTQSFLIATVPPIIFLCYSAHPFYAAIMLNHSSSKMSSVIHHCYSAQSFLYCKGAQPFLVTTAHGAAQSFCKMTRFGHRHARTGGGSWLGHGGMGPNRMCGATRPSHVHEVRGLVTLARLDRGWLVQVMGLPVHHYR
jgi:hypothetical protein